ncbi:hypothetical protein EV121DRAFT_274278 [Schizophyllum commune]
MVQPESPAEAIARMASLGHPNFALVKHCRTLIEDARLRVFSLAFNPLAQILVCTVCEHQVRRDCYKHLRDLHGMSKKGQMGRDIDTVIRVINVDLGVPTALRTFAPTVEPRAFIEGLASASVQGCSECPFVSSRRSAVNVHIAACAQGAKVLEDILVQRPNQDKAYIRVQPSRPRATGLVEQLLAANSAQRELLVTPQEDSRLINPLLKRTQWPMHLAGLNIDDVRRAARFPDAHEFGDLHNVVISYLEHATNSLNDTEGLVLQRLNTSKPEQGINNTPLHRHDKTGVTVRQYSVTVTRLVATLLREGSPLALPVSDALRAALVSLRHRLCVHQDAEISDLHAVLSLLWLTEWRRAGTANSMSDPTLAYLAMYAVKADGTYIDAKAFTTPLAHLTRAIQLCALTEIHVLLDDQSSSADGSRLRPTAGAQLEAAEPLLMFVQENNLSTFAALRSYTHYATALAQSTLAMPSVWWLDTQNHTELLIRGDRLSLAHLRTIVRNLHRTIATLYRSLTAGLPTDVDYARLRDDLRNTARGYTVFDTVWRDSPSDIRDFATALLEDPTLGLTQLSDGELAFHAITAWLENLAELELLVVVCVQFSCGGPARGTEIVALLLRNISTALRNAYVFGQRICLVRSYSKTTNLQQRDKVIPISLSSFLGDIFARIHIWLRPIAIFFARHIFPARADAVSELYRDMCFTGMGQPFSSDDLSRAMGLASLPVTQFELKLAKYRHSYIAFNEQLVEGFKADGDPDDDESDDIDAQQAGHSVDVARRIYGLSHDTFIGTTVRTIHLYLRNSDRWQIILHIRPGGSALPYSAVPSVSEDAADAGAPAPSPTTVDQLAQLFQSQCNTILTQMAILQDQNAQLQAQLVTSRASSASQHAAGLIVPSSTSHALTSTFPSFSQPPPPLGSAAPQYANDLDNEGHLQDAADLSAGSSAIANAVQSVQVEQDSTQLAAPAPVPDNFEPLNSAADIMDIDVPHPLPPSAMWAGKTEPAHVVDRRPEPQAQQPPAMANDCRSPPKEPYSDAQDVPLTDAIWVARQLLNDPSAVWKCKEQWAGIAALATLAGDVIVAARTAAGKSLIAIVPTYFEQGVTVILVPLRALLRDWIRRFKQMRVEFEHYTGGDSHISGDKRIILLSVDVARFSGWRDALLRLQERDVLILRIIVDEAQLVLTSSDFRKSLRDMHEVRCVNAPVVLFTANCPPDALPFYVDEFGLENPTLIRGCTDRPEIRYHVTKPMDLDQVTAYVEQLKRQYLPEGETVNRYMVFAFSLVKGRDLSNRLNLPFYRGENEEGEFFISDREQADMYNQWLSGDPPGIVCTTALSAGNDCRSVVFILIYEPFPDAIEIIQMAGRAMRTGLPCLVTIVPAPFLPKLSAGDDLRILRGYHPISQILYAMPNWPVSRYDRCIRYVILKYNDGVGRRCFDVADAQLCMYCREYADFLTRDEMEFLRTTAFPGNDVPPLLPLRIAEIAPALTKSELKQSLNERFAPLVAASTYRTAERTAHELAEVERYRQILRRINKRCGYCYAISVSPNLSPLTIPWDMDHDIEACPHVRSLTDFWHFKSSIKYGSDAMVCYTCHFTSLNDQIHGAFTRGDEYHPDRRSVLPLAWAVFTQQPLRDLAYQTLDVESTAHDWSDSLSFARWMSDASATGCPCSGMALMSFIWDLANDILT